MSLISDGTIFIIDSANRTTGSDADFSYTINVPKGKNYDSVVMLQALLPKSYYLIQSPYNTFTLSENGVNTTVTVQPGNYNARSWTTLFASLLTSSSSQGWTYTITFPNSVTQVDTGLFTYTVSGNGGVQPQFIFPAKTVSNIFEQAGFSAGSTNVFVGNTLTSTQICKFQQEDVLYLHSDMALNSDQSSNSDVLQEIYCSSTPPFSNVTYNNFGIIEAYSKILRSADNNNYKFTLTNENNQVMNLNGLNCVFTLLVYKKDRISESIRRFFARTILNQEEEKQTLARLEQEHNNKASEEENNNLEE